ncbi:hypothetical protein IMZ48_35790 [Candidatus Bathyarchaeota archaeon]|nr:hypothetical protein [Candidatus Bathyarchaeota archaeon]
MEAFVEEGQVSEPSGEDDETKVGRGGVLPRSLSSPVSMASPSDSKPVEIPADGQDLSASSGEDRQSTAPEVEHGSGNPLGDGWS